MMNRIVLVIGLFTAGSLWAGGERRIERSVVAEINGPSGRSTGDGANSSAAVESTTLYVIKDCYGAFNKSDMDVLQKYRFAGDTAAMKAMIDDKRAVALTKGMRLSSGKESCCAWRRLVTIAGQEALGAVFVDAQYLLDPRPDGCSTSKK